MLSSAPESECVPRGPRLLFASPSVLGGCKKPCQDLSYSLSFAGDMRATHDIWPYSQSVQ